VVRCPYRWRRNLLTSHLRKRPLCIGSFVKKPRKKYAKLTVDGGTSEAARNIISAKGVPCIDLGNNPPNDWLTFVFQQVETEWILTTYDDEIPSPAMLAFVDGAVKFSTKFVWGFPRVSCRYDYSSDELQYSQFLPFGPLANATFQWRLLARGDDPKERRTAGAEAILFDFDWVARTFAERVERIRYPSSDDQSSKALSSFRLYEAIPESWHRLARLRDRRFEALARAIYGPRDAKVTTDLGAPSGSAVYGTGGPHR
jgi:hypothetical protein